MIFNILLYHKSILYLKSKLDLNDPLVIWNLKAVDYFNELYLLNRSKIYGLQELVHDLRGKIWGMLNNK